MPRLGRERRRFAALVLVPVIGLFVAIRVGPILANLLLSFTDYRLLRRRWRMVGVANFSTLLSDPSFLLALRNSLEFALVAVPSLIVASLGIALLVNRTRRAQPWFQAIYFLPFILPAVATTVVWKWIYAPGELGLGNAALRLFGLAPVGWLSTPSNALLAVIMLYVWKNLGLYTVVFLVGLKTIPRECREAAVVDGASGWRIMSHIELPLLRPQLLFALVYSTIMAWSVFTEVYVMTQGSDVTSAGAQVDVITTFLYREGFVYLNTARASTISVILLVVIMTIVLVQMRIVTRGER